MQQSPTGPFSPRELVARIKAILKRTARVDVVDGPMQREALSVDVDRHLSGVGGVDVAQTTSEFSLLAVPMRRPDHVTSRAQLVDEIYGANIHVSDRTIDSHIRNLRAKLADAGLADAVVTVHGVGLRMGPCKA